MTAAVGVSSALLSTVALAIMISFDRIMMGDVYRNRPEQAWFISSVLGASFGILACSLLWTILLLSGYTSTGSALEQLLATVDHSGLAMLASGCLSIQVMKYYFKLFIPQSGSQANETSIALWLSASPVFIYLSIALVQNITPDSIEIGGLADANTTYTFGIVTLLCVASLVAFEVFDVDKAAKSNTRYRDICLMLACIVCYTLLISGLLRDADTSLERMLSLQVWYWIGFASAGRLWLRGKFRKDFQRNGGRIRKFAGAILLVEVLGMLVYLFEYGALSFIDPTLTKLIIGSHAIVVFLLSCMLAGLRTRLEVGGVRRVWFFGLRVTTAKLPNTVFHTGKVVRLLIAQAMLALVLLHAYS